MSKPDQPVPATRATRFDPAAFLEAEANESVVSTYAKGRVIFAQGDAADSVFYIKKGQVKIAVVSYEGKDAVVGILGPGELLGERCLSGQQTRVATASSLTECTTTKVPKSQAQNLLQKYPEFSQFVISSVLARSARIEEDLIDQLFNSTERRLARLLLLLAKFGQEDRPGPMVGKVSQEVLAEMIGTTRSRVSYFMNKFRRLGFINYNGKLEVYGSLLSVVLNDIPGSVTPRE